MMHIPGVRCGLWQLVTCCNWWDFQPNMMRNVQSMEGMNHDSRSTVIAQIGIIMDEEETSRGCGDAKSHGSTMRSLTDPPGWRHSILATTLATAPSALRMFVTSTIGVPPIISSTPRQILSRGFGPSCKDSFSTNTAAPEAAAIPDQCRLVAPLITCNAIWIPTMCYEHQSEFVISRKLDPALKDKCKQCFYDKIKFWL